jgi:hypothetical protein
LAGGGAGGWAPSVSSALTSRREPQQWGSVRGDRDGAQGVSLPYGGDLAMKQTIVCLLVYQLLVAIPCELALSLSEGEVVLSWFWPVVFLALS